MRDPSPRTAVLCHDSDINMPGEHVCSLSGHYRRRVRLCSTQIHCCRRRKTLRTFISEKEGSVTGVSSYFHVESAPLQGERKYISGCMCVYVCMSGTENVCLFECVSVLVCVCVCVRVCVKGMLKN